MSIMKDQRAPAMVVSIRRYFPEVDKVVDATKPLDINVTKKDVKSSKKKSEDACAMAKACERLPGIDGAVIKTTTAYVVKGNVATRYHVPICVGREIVSFDRHSDFRPGKYFLYAISKSQRIGVKSQVGGSKARTGGKATGPKKHARRIVHSRTAGIRGVRATPHDA